MQDRFCPQCHYDFIEYMKKDIKADRCPNCFYDMRLNDLEEWEIECKGCGSYIVSHSYNNKEDGIENNECPECGTKLKESWDKFNSPKKDKCPYCGSGMENIYLDGNVKFTSLGKRDSFGDIMVFNSNGLGMEISLRCGNCNSVLNHNFYSDLVKLQNRLLMTFKVGDV